MSMRQCFNDTNDTNLWIKWQQFDHAQATRDLSANILTPTPCASLVQPVATYIPNLRGPASFQYFL